MGPESIISWVVLVALGLVVGGLGTLVGAGGGFILMPVLVLLYPHDEPEVLASISLAVVFCNAASGSAGYAVQRRIDYRAGLLFSAAAVPGAIIGAATTEYLPRHTFDVLLGSVLIVAAVFLAVSAVRKGKQFHAEESNEFSPRVRYKKGLGAAISAAVGFVSSLLGIGGGIIHVPALVFVLGFPVHVATATSHFVLAITALAGTAVHARSGTLQDGWGRIIPLGIGVIIGAQIGARFASRTHPLMIIRGLAVALVLVGIRIVYAAI